MPTKNNNSKKLKHKKEKQSVAEETAKLEWKEKRRKRKSLVVCIWHHIWVWVCGCVIGMEKRSRKNNTIQIKHVNRLSWKYSMRCVLMCLKWFSSWRKFLFVVPLSLVLRFALRACVSYCFLRLVLLFWFLFFLNVRNSTSQSYEKQTYLMITYWISQIGVNEKSTQHWAHAHTHAHMRDRHGAVKKTKYLCQAVLVIK